MDKHHALGRSGHRKVYWVPKHREGVAHARGWGLVLQGPGMRGSCGEGLSDRGRHAGTALGIFILDPTGVGL